VAEARLLHDLVRIGEPDVAADRLSELATLVDGDLVGAFAAHAGALVRGSAQDLEAVALRFEELGAWLLAAEASSAASAAFGREGLARRSNGLARRSEELRVLCGDVRTPGLAANDAVGRLTRREREIATLAADGASSRDIAARLYVSVRTVENHLQRAYEKLGVTGREALGSVLLAKD
jgi:DNA-binding NarL/FixJ family response regulator